MQTSAYYKPSGKAPIAAIVACLVIGLVVAIPGASIYATAVYYVPFIYLNFFFCLGLTALLGLAINAAGKKFHLRNPLVATLIGLFCGLSAEYVQWVVYILLYYGTPISQLSSSFLRLAGSPDIVTATISRLGEDGLWSVFNFEVKGALLYGIWLVEAAIIIIGTILSARENSTKPYSETCGQWMEPQGMGVALEYKDTPESIITALESGSLAPLMNAPLASTDEKFLNLVIYSCKGDPYAYLSVEDITLKKAKKDNEKPEYDTNVIVSNIAITEAQAKELSAAMQSLKNSD